MNIGEKIQKLEMIEVKELHEKTKLFQQSYWIEREYSEFPDRQEYYFSEKKKLEITKLEQNISLTEVLKNRASIRNFDKNKMIDFKTLSNLLYYSLIKSRSTNYRPYPSAGKRYPISCYLITLKKSTLDEGLYFIDQNNEELCLIMRKQFQGELHKMFLEQPVLNTAEFLIVFTANFNNTIEKYGTRGYRYVFLDCGHIAQNLTLVGESIGIGHLCLGGFFDDSLKSIINTVEEPIYAMAFGIKEE